MDDEKIIELYWKRSENAISETDIKYGSLCRHIAKNIVSDLRDVDECVNDTYLAAWNAMPPKKPDILFAFLARITRNISLKKIEYYSAKKRNPKLTVSYDELENCIPDIESVESEIELNELTSYINNFLELQKPEHKIIFVRRYWYFDSINEIAYSLRLSESKVKSILFRMRNKLKDYLNNKGAI